MHAGCTLGCIVTQDGCMRVAWCTTQAVCTTEGLCFTRENAGHKLFTRVGGYGKGKTERRTRRAPPLACMDERGKQGAEGEQMLGAYLSMPGTWPLACMEGWSRRLGYTVARIRLRAGGRASGVCLARGLVGAKECEGAAENWGSHQWASPCCFCTSVHRTAGCWGVYKPPCASITHTHTNTHATALACTRGTCTYIHVHAHSRGDLGAHAPLLLQGVQAQRPHACRGLRACASTAAVAGKACWSQSCARTSRRGDCMHHLHASPACYPHAPPCIHQIPTASQRSARHPCPLPCPRLLPCPSGQATIHPTTTHPKSSTHPPCIQTPLSTLHSHPRTHPQMQAARNFQGYAPEPSAPWPRALACTTRRSNMDTSRS